MTIKHESDTVDGTRVYCNACGQGGPWTAYDNIDDTEECAKMAGWVIGDDGDVHTCPECVAKLPAPHLPARKRVKRQA